jgi:dTDP-4-dehydrorhamnose reductase
MQVLITGANGFLGHYLTSNLISHKIPVIATGKGACRRPFDKQDYFQYAELDFTDSDAVIRLFGEIKPTVVVHAGAMSKPDECELQKEKARQVNVAGTNNLLVAAALHHCHFIFISTDFVFDGERGMYSEDDKPNPVNYYGQTKLEAEALVSKYSDSWAIVRTVLVYGKPLSGKENILTVVKGKLEKGEEYKVVSDQVRTPTYVEDLAAAITTIIQQKQEGLWHISGDEVLTPFDMAIAVADFLKLNKNLLKNVTANTFSQPARRPAKTGFDISKAKKELGFTPIPFAEGLQKTLTD